MQVGKFLGFMLTSRGIEANPNKYEAILVMRSPASIKEVHQLIGWITALSCFLPKSVDREKPFFQCLKKLVELKWMEECETAFQELKTFLAAPLILSWLEPGEELSLYLFVTTNALSIVLIKEEGKM